jgi:hypothetical protein
MVQASPKRQLRQCAQQAETRQNNREMHERSELVREMPITSMFLPCDSVTPNTYIDKRKSTNDNQVDTPFMIHLQAA